MKQLASVVAVVMAGVCGVYFISGGGRGGQGRTGASSSGGGTPTDAHPNSSALQPVARMLLEIESPGGPIPVRLVRDRRNPDREVTWLINGEEKLEVDVLDLGDRSGSMLLRFPPFDSELRARRTDPETDVMVPAKERRNHAAGTWTLKRNGRVTRMPVRITRQDSRVRFKDLPPGKSTAPLGDADVDPQGILGRWEVRFGKDSEIAVGIFEVAPKTPKTKIGTARIHGTFLTTVGDYRYLAGDFDGQQLRLSCFDGAHAFLFKATLQPDGSLSGDFWSRDTWHQTWTAVRNPGAALPDPLGLSSWQAGTDLASLRFPSADPDEGELSLADPRWADKPMILHLFGTWCPNCRDASKLMARLHHQYRDAGIQVVGLAFEHEGTLAEQRARIQSYRRVSGAEYPILVVGTSDKAAASKAFPAISRVRAYPTTIFLDRDRNAAGVYTGFTGPAAPGEHERLVERFERLTRQLSR